jgi:hypothetical protein
MNDITEILLKVGLNTITLNTMKPKETQSDWALFNKIFEIVTEIWK